MASEFYKRTKNLFEEFQKRELHYLNTEKIISNKFDSLNELNMPVEDYLQMLNKREKESEETYKGLMHHFEELDRRTENLYEKLEKLSSLKISMSSKIPWSQFNKSYENFPDYTPSVVMQSTSISKNTPLKTFQPSSFTVATMTASTQTDEFFCGNCQFPISISTPSNIEYPSISVPSGSIAKPLQKTNLTSLFNENPSVLSQLNDSASGFSTSYTPKEEEHSRKKPIDLKNLALISDDVTGINPNIFNDSASGFSTSKTLNEEESSRNKIMTLKNPASISDNVTGLNQNIFKDIAIYEENNNQLMSKINNETETKPLKTESMDMKQQVSEDVTSISDSVEKIVSKSDDESLNHEFDFLDSDKKYKSVPLINEKVSEISDVKETENVISDTIVTVENAESNAQVTNEVTPDNDTTLTIPGVKSKSTLEVNVQNIEDDKDKRSESSISIGGGHSPPAHSENVSAVSDSDSFYEKEDSPLKASAAYQALLGNVSANKNISKDVYSESETEDEVERVLANATRKKSNIPVTLSEQEDKSNDTKKVSDSKPKPEPRKSISLTKPQQLSKNTRKVLGLDTSSGSEGEVRVPAKTNSKIDEDSDEFDFYD